MRLGKVKASSTSKRASMPSTTGFQASPRPKVDGNHSKFTLFE